MNFRQFREGYMQITFSLEEFALLREKLNSAFCGSMVAGGRLHCFIRMKKCQILDVGDVLCKYNALSLFHSFLFSRLFFITCRQKFSAKSISVILRSNNFAVDLIYVYEIMEISNMSFPVG
jgi:hypothetical protein